MMPSTGSVTPEQTPRPKPGTNGYTGSRQQGTRAQRSSLEERASRQTHESGRRLILWMMRARNTGKMAGSSVHVSVLP